MPDPRSRIPSPYLYRVKVDYLIVGQGIAGSTLAMTLHCARKRVLIINKEGLSSSSAVAAGIYNPFNFRKSIPTPFAKKAAPAARSFYEEMEVLTRAKFHSAKNIVRIFGSAEEQKNWSAYIASPEHIFASEIPIQNNFRDKFTAPFGGGLVTGGGVLNTGQYIFAVKEFFSGQNLYRNEKFNIDNLEFSEEEVIYNGDISAGKIVFCEGFLASQNKYYPRLSIAPTKGETLHVHIPGLSTEEVINGSVYLSPLGNDLYDCGATFNPGRTDEEITESGRDEIISKLRSMLRLEFRPESQFAGIRPAGRDRKPVIGVSRENGKIAFFNGFGSKAVLLAPYFAQMLADHLENQAELPPEINVSRFKVY